VGFDLDDRKVAAIAEGRSYIPDVPTSDVESLTRAGRLTATSDFTQLAAVDTVIDKLAVAAFFS
jgi:UDP-N-acetyl-D-glucosamine dehydrogenase